MVTAFVFFDDTTVLANTRYSLPTLPEGMRPPREIVAPAFVTNGYGVAIAYKKDGTGYMSTGSYGAGGVNVYGVLTWFVAD